MGDVGDTHGWKNIRVHCRVVKATAPENGWNSTLVAGGDTSAGSKCNATHVCYDNRSSKSWQVSWWLCLNCLCWSCLLMCLTCLCCLLKCWTLKCCFLRCRLQKLALVRDVLEVPVLVLLADVLEVQHAVVLVVVLVRLEILVLELLADMLIDVLVLLVKVLVAEMLAVQVPVKEMLEVPVPVLLADVLEVELAVVLVMVLIVLDCAACWGAGRCVWCSNVMLGRCWKCECWVQLCQTHALGMYAMIIVQASHDKCLGGCAWTVYAGAACWCAWHACAACWNAGHWSAASWDAGCRSWRWS